MIGALVLLAAALSAAPAPATLVKMFITNDDYPPEAFRNHWSGVVAYTLTIDADGSVKDCMVTGSSGYQVLDDTTCRVMKTKVIFKPAIDGDGRPIISIWSNTLSWGR